MKNYPILENMKPNMDVFYASWKLVYDNIFDKSLRKGKWARIGARYIERAKKAKNHRQLHLVIQEMFDELKVSHLRIMDQEIYEHDILSETNNIKMPSFGLDIEKLKKGFFIREVVLGSSGQESGLRRGDQILKIQGQPVELSSLIRPSGTGGVFRLHPRFPLSLQVKRNKNIFQYTLSPKAWNRISASEISQKVFLKNGKRLCYVHIWHLANYRMLEILKEFVIKGKNCHGLILDLRGFGGAIIFLQEFLETVRSAKKPIVAIIDKETRSIKETISVHLKKEGLATLVGEKTIGSCLASQFFDLPDGSKVILPVRNMRSLTAGKKIEGNGVKPHINVPISVPHLNGQDPHLEKAIEVLLKKVEGKAHMSLGDYLYGLLP